MLKFRRRFRVSTMIALALFAPSPALADGAPAATSSDHLPKNTRIRFDLGPGSLRLDNQNELEARTGLFSDSTGAGGGTAELEARHRTYLNGVIHADSSRGFLLEPGVRVRIDGDSYERRRLELDASAFTAYRAQGISGSGHVLPKEAAEYRAHHNRYMGLLRQYRETAETYQLDSRIDSLEQDLLRQEHAAGRSEKAIASLRAEIEASEAGGKADEAAKGKARLADAEKNLALERLDLAATRKEHAEATRERAVEQPKRVKALKAQVDDMARKMAERGYPVPGERRPDDGSEYGEKDLYAEYVDALESYVSCSSYCNGEESALSRARLGLEAAKLPLPAFEKVHGTVDLSILRGGYRYADSKSLELRQNLATLDFGQLSAHGAFALNDVNIDVCALVAIGAVAGRFESGPNRVDTGFALRGAAKACGGVQVGELFNLRGEAGIEGIAASEASNVSTKRAWVGAEVARIGGTPISVGARAERETAEVEGRETGVTTKLVTAGAAF